MGNFKDNREVRFNDLEKSGIYSKNIIDILKEGRYELINKYLNDREKNDKDIMEPLLYAVRNEKGGNYEIFKHYGRTLQEDIQSSNDLILAIEIINYKPELIKDTPLNDYESAIIEGAKTRPEVIKFMSNELKTDITFIEQLCETSNNEISKYAARECKVLDQITQNSSLASNAEFMKEAIKRDAELLEKTSPDLKNNYEFIRETSKENYEVVEYIINKKDEFGLEAIKGAKETTRELTVEKSIDIIDEMSVKSDDKRYAMVAEKVRKEGKDDVRSVRWTTAMAAQSDKVTPEYFKKVFDDSILAMMEIKKDLTPEGKEKVSIDKMQTMVTPKILNKLKEKAMEQGLEVDQDLEIKMQEYTEFFNSYREMLKEEKAKQRQNNDKYRAKDTEEVTKNASLNGIKDETTAIRDRY